jgi:septal ring factor EnvC (AmiA/AmiB activator)
MKFSFFLLIIFIGFLLCRGSMADEVDDKTKDLTGLKAKINSTVKAIKDLKTHKQSLQMELKALETKYGKSVGRLVRLERQINRLKETLEKNRRQKQIKQQEINSQKQGLVNQVKTAYRMGRNERLKLMLNQQDPALSGRVMVYYDYLNKARLNKIVTIDQDIQVLHDLDIQHSQESALLEKKLVARKQSQMTLMQAKTERKALLAKIDRQFRSKTQQLSRFKQSEKKLASLILALEEAKDDFSFDEGSVKGFSSLKGTLPWPIKGKLLKKFGDRRSDSRWNGVLIKAKVGQEVRAVTRGQVVFADWLRGYGLLTIIKHDKNYMTLYAFSQSIYKTKGDWVDAGTVISTVGLSGGRSKAGLYFAIRKKGKPVNPIKWCRKIRHGKVG